MIIKRFHRIVWYFEFHFSDCCLYLIDEMFDKNLVFICYLVWMCRCFSFSLTLFKNFYNLDKSFNSIHFHWLICINLSGNREIINRRITWHNSVPIKMINSFLIWLLIQIPPSKTELSTGTIATMIQQKNTENN